MNLARLLAGLLAISAYQAPAQAIPLLAPDPITGIVSPSPGGLTHLPTLSFNAGGFLAGHVITTQFEGVTFSGLFYHIPPVPPVPGLFPDASLANFNDLTAAANDVSFNFFPQRLTAVAFALLGEPFVIMTIEARLSGADPPVETYLIESRESPTDFFGFTNIEFDEVRIISGGRLLQIDNLQFSATSVPESGTLALLGLGFAGLFVLKRRGRA